MKMQKKLNQLKDEFREWCGLLSVEEILSNTQLVRTIERLERMLNEATQLAALEGGGKGA